ncbi:hypothetical protein [Minwuia sp.]|uniref:hypothetical protein n=1 Tax=Minwuia sp. TaxID=2493630 RepID=UPI003A9041A6
MSTVNIQYDAARELVIFTAIGLLTIEDFIAAGDAHFLNHATSCSIWDLRKADLSSIRLDNMHALSRRSADVSKSRPDPRTALVVDDDGKRALVRLYEALAESTGTPVIYRIFGTLEDAVEWIDQERGS